MLHFFRLHLSLLSRRMMICLAIECRSRFVVAMLKIFSNLKIFWKLFTISNKQQSISNLIDFLLLILLHSINSTRIFFIKKLWIFQIEWVNSFSKFAKRQFEFLLIISDVQARRYVVDKTKISKSNSKVITRLSFKFQFLSNVMSISNWKHWQAK